LRSQLREGDGNVTNAIYDAGYSSSSRAYEWSPLGMTPGRFLAGGRGETIRYATAECSGAPALGWILVAGTARGLCWVSLGSSAKEVEASLRAEFPAATLTEDSRLQDALTAVLQSTRGETSTAALPLDLRGTAFQLRVWHALQQIPPGETRSYSQLAAEMGNPSATRAVARACATNRVAVLIPCHRVVGASGSLTGYRWGVERKRQLLAAEASSGAR
jgi:AraC family transcriptional regulator of adaptative response/methylated-DNA-[protein]-cysteine methyltransferase